MKNGEGAGSLYKMQKEGVKMERLEELEKIFEKVDEDKAKVIKPLLSDVVFMEGRLKELRELPHIRVHPTNQTKQETTAAGKQYKETMQAYLNAIKVLQMTLSRFSEEAEDAFDAWLKENGNE